MSDIDSSDHDLRIGEFCGTLVLSAAKVFPTNRTNLSQVTEIVNMHDAKTNFSKLVAKVEAGAEIVIARGGRPCARLVPIVAETPTLGTMKGRWPELDDEFFAPLTGDDLDAWNA